MKVTYNGYINQQELKGAIGAKGGVNPIATQSTRRPEYIRAFEIRERQQVIRRYRWTGLPKGLSATMMERILYYRGRIVLFKMNDKYYALPFALNGSIDIYGRYQTVTPLTFNGSVLKDSNGDTSMGDGEFLPDKQLKVCYDLNEIEDKDCVILNDYSQGVSEFIIPRYQANLYLNSDMADIIVLIRHNLISSARISSLRCLDEGQKGAVMAELDDLEDAILNQGRRIFPVVSSTELKEFISDKSLETQQYWECFVSLDNLRENLIGIENNGIFKKKERVLKGEQELEAGSADLVYSDGLYNRQCMCEIFNAMFGENIWCEESEVVSGFDTDKDGNIDDAEGEKKGEY